MNKMKWLFAMMCVLAMFAMTACDTLPADDGKDDDKGDNVTVKTFTVKFDTNGGSTAPADQTVDNGAKATKPATDPTKDSNTFGGWFNGETKWDFATATVSANVTLKAKWLSEEAVFLNAIKGKSGSIVFGAMPGEHDVAINADGKMITITVSMLPNAPIDYTFEEAISGDRAIYTTTDKTATGMLGEFAGFEASTGKFYRGINADSSQVAEEALDTIWVNSTYTITFDE